MSNLLVREREERDKNHGQSTSEGYYQLMPPFHYSSSPPSSPSSMQDLPSSSPPSSPGARFDITNVADDEGSSPCSHWTRHEEHDRTFKGSDRERGNEGLNVASSSRRRPDLKVSAGKRRRSVEVITPPNYGGKRSRPRFREPSSDEMEEEDLTPKPTLFHGFKNDDLRYKNHFEKIVASSRSIAQELWDSAIAEGIEGSTCKIDMG